MWKKQNEEVNHYQTEYYLDIQRGKYICVDDSIDEKVIMKNNKKQFEIRCNENKDAYSEFKKKRTQSELADVSIRYCLEQEVVTKQRKAMMEKSKLYYKLQHLKHNGEKVLMTEKLKRLIDANID